MKLGKAMRSVAVAAIVVWVLGLTGYASDTASPGELKVMTFNVRVPLANPTPADAWVNRRQPTAECIRTYSPDLIGTQEGVYFQLKQILADQGGVYDWIGLGREGGSRGEFMAIFYRKDRLEPLEYDHFWLSDTPDVMGSKTWGPKLPRMVTWVRFKDRATDQEFYLINTHLDHQVQVAREKSAELIRKRVEELNTALPIILTGDFNANAQKNKVYDILTSDGFFTDTWFTAPKNLGPTDVGSTNGTYTGPKQGNARIDWILTRGPVTAETIEVITFKKDEHYPSDHFPVMTQLKIGKPAAAKP